MSEKIVAHPETGLPAREVKTYIELDREQLEQEVKANEADLEELVSTKRAEFEASLDEDEDVKTARSAVQDSKSELEVYDQLAPVADSGAGEEGTSSEVSSDDEAGDESDAVDESEGDSGEDSGAVNVPVSVTAGDSSTDDDDEDDEDEEAETEEEKEEENSAENY